MITAIPASDIPQAWPLISQYVGILVGKDLKLLYLDSCEGLTQIWFLHEPDDLQGIAITAVTKRGEDKVLELFYLAGKCGMKNYRKGNQMLTELKDFYSAGWLELRTKRKMNRLLASFGWQQCEDFWWRN